MNIQTNTSETVKNGQISCNSKINTSNCFAVILAGGHGVPKQMLIPNSLRGQCPPQFLRKAGEDFLINQTRERIETVFPSYKIFLTLTETHSRYYEDILADVPLRNQIVQPQDDGTTFEILYAAMRFAKVNPRAILAFFPMEFSTSDDKAFFAHVESACLTVSRKPQLILIGSEEELENDKYFLNNSVMIGTSSTFLRKIKRAAPDIYAKFASIHSKIGTREEEKAIRNIYYAHLSQSDFSKDVLEKSMDKVVLMPVSDAASIQTKKPEKAEIFEFVS